jgi:hypothetical protein
MSERIDLHVTAEYVEQGADKKPMIKFRVVDDDGTVRTVYYGYTKCLKAAYEALELDKK